MTHSKRQLNGAANERDEERRRFQWALAGLAAVFTTIVLVACGGSETNPVSPTVPASPAPPPAPRLIRQGSVPMDAPTDDAFHFFLTPITDGASGRWDATVDWSNEANTLWMWVADGVCSGRAVLQRRLPVRRGLPVPIRESVRDRDAEAARAHHSRRRRWDADAHLREPGTGRGDRAVPSDLDRFKCRHERQRANGQRRCRDRQRRSSVHGAQNAAGEEVEECV